MNYVSIIISSSDNSRNSLISFIVYLNSDDLLERLLLLRIIDNSVSNLFTLFSNISCSIFNNLLDLLNFLIYLIFFDLLDDLLDDLLYDLLDDLL